MNILLLIDAMDIGGAETHLVTLALGLQEAGHCVGVVSSGGCLEGQLIERGIAVWHFPCPVRDASFGLSLGRHIAFLRQLHRRHGFDIMHAHTRRTAMILRVMHALGVFHTSRRWTTPSRPSWSASAPSLPYRRRAMRRLRAPALIVTAHAKFTPHHRRLSYWGEATIAVSNDLKSHIKQAFLVPDERISVIPNGIDERVFFRSRLVFEDRQTVSVVFASRLDKDCSAAAKALIEIAPSLADAARERGKRLRMTILGGGDQYTDMAMRAEQARARWEDHEALVRMVGASANPAAFFRDADVFVGVSRAALEAILCGCLPILAGNEGYGGPLTEQNFDAFAEQNFCCRGQKNLVGPELQQALYEAILCVLDMTKEQKAARSDALVRRVRWEYSAVRMCEQTVRLYERTLTQKRRLRVLIGGYAGCGNLGDDAILRCLIRRWHGQAAPVCLTVSGSEAIAACATLSLTALTGDMEQFDIPCVKRTHGASLLRAMRKADAFVLGGGALLQNRSTHGNRSLCYYLALLSLARVCGCPFCLVANGIGPLQGRLSRFVTGCLLGQAQDISVRDEHSEELLERLLSVGVAPKHIRIEPDPVLSVMPDREAARRLLCAHGVSDRYVCIVPRPTDPHTLRALTEVVWRLWEEYGIQSLFFALDRQNDVPVCRAMMQESGVGVLMPCEREETVAGLFAQSKGVVSLRLHGLILSQATGARAVCVPYSKEDEKAIHFSNATGQAVANGADELWERVNEMLKTER